MTYMLAKTAHCHQTRSNRLSFPLDEFNSDINTPFHCFLDLFSCYLPFAAKCYIYPFIGPQTDIETCWCPPGNHGSLGERCVFLDWLSSGLLPVGG